MIADTFISEPDQAFKQKIMKDTLFQNNAYEGSSPKTEQK